MNTNVEVQTRNGDGEILHFPTVGDALRHSKKDRTVWKISFSLPNGERIRLTRADDYYGNWNFSPLGGFLKYS